MRELIRQAAPDVVEEWKWHVPVRSHEGIPRTGETYYKAVKLTFPGRAALDDPAGIFNASREAMCGAPATSMRTRSWMKRRSKD